ncbi:MAG: aspartate-semialdehyde dehydrogenase, partial [Acidaminococcaceae bacterium]|nr:aspartate-semialdehyde dehydrogenase [Acidaminococcaceae bacterium]
MKRYNLAILGATGAVGQEFIKLLNERDFPFDELRLLASAKSIGKQYEIKGKMYTVQEATQNSFKGIDIALFAGGSI